MSDTRTAYIVTLRNLRKCLWDHFYWLRLAAGDECVMRHFRHVRNRWCGYHLGQAVDQAARLAAELQLPPAVRFRITSGKDVPSVDPTTLEGLTPGAEWRLSSIEVINVQDTTPHSWPLGYEERVRGGWVIRGYLKRRFPDDTRGCNKAWNDAEKMPCILDDWMRCVAIVPLQSGILDTPFHNVSTWREHCEAQAEMEVKHLLAFHGFNGWRALRAEGVPCATQRDVDAKADAVRDRYKAAGITAHFAKRSISSYMQYLVKTYVDEPRQRREGILKTSKTRTKADAELASVEAFEEQFRPKYEAAIAGNVARLFRLVIPLDLDDAPDIPVAERMTHTEALVLLDKLKKCCIRRMKEQGDTRWLNTDTPVVPDAAEGEDDDAGTRTDDDVPEDKRVPPSKQAELLDIAQADKVKRLKAAAKVREGALAAGLQLRTVDLGNKGVHVHADDFAIVVRWWKGGQKAERRDDGVVDVAKGKAVEKDARLPPYSCERCGHDFRKAKNVRQCPKCQSGQIVPAG